MVNVLSNFSRKSSSAHMGVDIDSKALLSPNAPAINKDVDAAARKYETMEQKLDTLIEAVKDQHVTMKHANLKKMEALKLFEDFVKDTPLEPIVGPASVNLESSQEIKSKVPDMSQSGVPGVSKLNEADAAEKTEHLEDVPGLVEDRTFDSDSSSSMTEENQKEGNEEGEEEEQENEFNSKGAGDENKGNDDIVDDEDVEDNSHEDEEDVEDNSHEDEEGTNEKSTAKKMKDAASNAKDKMKDKVKKPFTKMSEASEDAKEKMKEAKDGMKEASDDMKEKLKKPFEDTEKQEAEERKEKYRDIAETMAHPFEPIDNIEHKTSLDDPNFSEIEKNIYVETSLILDDYIEQIVQYLESWKKINKTRIKAGLYEFKEMCEKLEHYQSKMNSMNQDKDQEKYERNQQKLLGILEAHTTYSEKLLRYIEEVTERGWKDFYPLLLNAMEFDLSYASAQYKYSAHLKSLVKQLKKKVGKEYDLQQHGRLQELESEPLGDVYTGERINPKPSYLISYPGKSSQQ